ncbi:cation diffusion facilitator family transporter [Marine Group I thaumarchaeote]|uniref:Cation diffusion facilitator family transporter n=1 Tax=Marine Group I thaumarchaeote TaxID=2511932 RepID=A0A7K4N4X4_9ARCH|nr:MAG: cation transporter [Nitrosopumilus sp. YT1]NMI81781.1 cation transporter [Candidatus Nitrosopumilus sp. MTA1]NWJ19719.1 cation diffusion facilitator family transporter [Marine Group I thaumarchaeote]NWJ56713.1 cation diffusion facilitator family transporter [Marine Group I thaumarchaeote]NWJ83488.1 cation diffusion facilitator family transporter [Marine Group I thaumarchaeote]
MFVQRTRVLQISFLAIFSAFVVELIFGLVSNSLALITDSIHALLDSVVTIVLLLAARWAIKPPDAEHTYGHGKIESLGGLIGGIAIFLIACFFIYESLNRLQSPLPSILPGLFAIIGGLYTIGIDIFRIVLLRKAIKKIGGAILKADFYHAFMDLGSTVVAIVGIVLISYGFYYGDFVAALILGGLLAVLSVKLIYRTALDLTDIISPELVKNVREIAMSTQGVIDANPILMRRSGDTFFVDITISLRGDTSFDKAHEISNYVERNIKNKISNAAITIHFEPNWKDVPLDVKILDVAKSVDGVKDVHNVSTHKTQGKTYSDLHVMVNKDINLLLAHKISEIVEQKIHKNIPEIEHSTIHLEPFVTVPENFNLEDEIVEEEIRTVLEKYPEIKKIGRIISLNFENILKIDIDCSFDRELSIEKVHDLTSKIEHVIRTQIKNAVITIHPEPD